MSRLSQLLRSKTALFSREVFACRSVTVSAVPTPLQAVSAAFYFYTKRHGGRATQVLGLEQYSVAHSKGSSHGESRIIRLAYHEHPAYVPLLKRAWDLWRELEAETGEVGQRMKMACNILSFPHFAASPDHKLSLANSHNLRKQYKEADTVNDHRK